MTEYKKRDHMALDDAGRYYIRHVSAMTGEKLHYKADIAAELGHRDMVIDTLVAALEGVLKIASTEPFPIGYFYDKPGAMGDALRALALAKDT